MQSKFLPLATAALMVLLALSATPSQAAYTTITYQGQVSTVAIPAQAPGISAGDRVTFSATFDTARLLPIGADFFNIDGGTGLPVSVPNLRAASLSDDPGASYSVSIGSAYHFTQADDYTFGEDYGLGAGNFPLVIYNGSQLLGIDGGAEAANGLQFDFDPLAFLLHYRSSVGVGYGSEAATQASFRVTTDLDAAIRSAVTPVPEPDTWALMVAGGTALALLRRRRR